MFVKQLAGLQLGYGVYPQLDINVRIYWVFFLLALFVRGLPCVIVWVILSLHCSGQVKYNILFCMRMCGINNGNQGHFLIISGIAGIHCCHEFNVTTKQISSVLRSEQLPKKGVWLIKSYLINLPFLKSSLGLGDIFIFSQMKWWFTFIIFHLSAIQTKSSWYF